MMMRSYYTRKNGHQHNDLRKIFAALEAQRHLILHLRQLLKQLEQKLENGGGRRTGENGRGRSLDEPVTNTIQLIPLN